MNDIMTYQYPSPGTPPPPYNTGYTVAPHMTGMTMRSPDQPGRNGSPAISFELKRATSQSNIKLDPEIEEANMAAAGEKKRNKLGYHRASAACSEKYPQRPPPKITGPAETNRRLGEACCRHRKIRCRPGSTGQKKCMQCEKLNKECKFESVSVNSGSPTESRHASMSRASAGNRMASASSSSSSAHTVDLHAAQHRGSMGMPPNHQMGLSDPPGLKSEFTTEMLHAASLDGLCLLTCSSSGDLCQVPGLRQPGYADKLDGARLRRQLFPFQARLLGHLRARHHANHP